MKICANGMCDIGIVEQYKAYCPLSLSLLTIVLSLSFHF